VPPQESGARGAVAFTDPEELLLRRVAKSHIEDGEVSLLAISRETSFHVDPQRCSSVLRSAFLESRFDAVRPNCAGGVDLAGSHTVMHVRVGSLPRGLQIRPLPPDSHERWDIYPHHDPQPLCYAHSTLCCSRQEHPNIAVVPPKSVRDQFREWLTEELTA